MHFVSREVWNGNEQLRKTHDSLYEIMALLCMLILRSRGTHMLTGFTYYITMRAVKRLIHLLLFHLPLEHIK